MTDQQARRFIESFAGGRRVMRDMRQWTDRFRVFYLNGCTLDIVRDSVTRIVIIRQDGKIVGDWRWN